MSTTDSNSIVMMMLLALKSRGNLRVLQALTRRKDKTVLFLGAHSICATGVLQTSGSWLILWLLSNALKTWLIAKPGYFLCLLEACMRYW